MNGHFYFLSSNVTEYAGQKMDWLDARNLCRKHCMDSISIETAEENDMVLSVLERGKQLHNLCTRHSSHVTLQQ